MGVYAVASNCTATLTMNSGQHYNAVLTDQGAQVFFVQSDAAGNGAAGVLQRSVNSCGLSQYPQSFAFQFNGATPAPSSGTTGAASPVTVTPFSSVGILSLDGNGNFAIAEYQYGATANGGAGTQALNFSGAYTIDANCTLNLSFDKSAAGTAGVPPPAAFVGLVGSNSPSGKASVGVTILQPSAGQGIAGTLVSQ